MLLVKLLGRGVGGFVLLLLLTSLWSFGNIVAEAFGGMGDEAPAAKRCIAWTDLAEVSSSTHTKKLV